MLFLLFGLMVAATAEYDADGSIKFSIRYNRNQGYGSRDYGRANDYGGYGYDDSSTCSLQPCNPPNSSTPSELGDCTCGPSSLVKPKFKPLKNYKKGRMNGGLCQHSYEGYWCDDVNFFKATEGESCSVQDTGVIEVGANQSVSYKLSGVFKASKSGKYSFRTTSNDASAIVMSHTAIVENLLVHAENECDSGSIYLKKGYYDISVYYGKDKNSYNFDSTFKDVGTGQCEDSAGNSINQLDELARLPGPSTPTYPGTYLTLEQCEAACVARANCDGVNWRADGGQWNCFLWETPAPPFITTNSANFGATNCYARQAGEGSLKFEWKSDKVDWTTNLDSDFFPGKTCECDNEGYGSYGGNHGYGSNSKNSGGYDY